MPAPAAPPPDNALAMVEFLRRLSSMLVGGRNSEALLQAASLIETLAHRSAAAEQLLADQEDEHARNIELREQAEATSDNLITEMDSLKAQREAELASMQEQLDTARLQFDDSQRRAETERNALEEKVQALEARAEAADNQFETAAAERDDIRQQAESAAASATEESNSLKAQFDAEISSLREQLDESRRRAEADQIAFTEQAQRLEARADVAESRLGEAYAELDAIRPAVSEPAIDASIAVVPVASLEIARTQFSYLAEGFASKGDLVSQTICEIGARAIDRALSGNDPG